jgi:hypothetical protein
MNNDNTPSLSYLMTRDEIRVHDAPLFISLRILFDLEDQRDNAQEDYEFMVKSGESHGACRNKHNLVEFLTRKCLEQEEVCRLQALPQYDPTYNHHRDGFQDIIKLLES